MIRFNISIIKTLDLGVAVTALVAGVAIMIMGVDIAFSDYHENLIVMQCVFSAMMVFASLACISVSMYFFGLIKFKGDNNEGNL